MLSVFPIMWMGRFDWDDVEVGGVTQWGEMFFLIIPRSLYVLTDREAHTGHVLNWDPSIV